MRGHDLRKSRPILHKVPAFVVRFSMPEMQDLSFPCVPITRATCPFVCYSVPKWFTVRNPAYHHPIVETARGIKGLLVINAAAILLRVTNLLSVVTARSPEAIKEGLKDLEEEKTLTNFKLVTGPTDTRRDFGPLGGPLSRFLHTYTSTEDLMHVTYGLKQIIESTASFAL